MTSSYGDHSVPIYIYIVCHLSRRLDDEDVQHDNMLKVNTSAAAIFVRINSIGISNLIIIVLVMIEQWFRNLNPVVYIRVTIWI